MLVLLLLLLLLQLKVLLLQLAVLLLELVALLLPLLGEVLPQHRLAMLGGDEGRCQRGELAGGSGRSVGGRSRGRSCGGLRSNISIELVRSDDCRADKDMLTVVGLVILAVATC